MHDETNTPHKHQAQIDASRRAYELKQGSSLSAPDVVYTMRQAATIVGIHVSTLRHMIWRGEGPTVIRLSRARVGIRASHLETWLKAREEPAGGQAA